MLTFGVRLETVNPWQEQRARSGWGSGLAEWTDVERVPTRDAPTAYISVAFTWLLAQAWQRAAWYRAQGYQVQVGGPAVVLRPGFFANVATEEWVLGASQKPDALIRHNSQATFTTRGCIRRCKFCAVPRIEGDLRELTDWEPRPTVCDNNLLAASRAHFDRVIDRLKPVANVDFNQGLDAKLLTAHHAARLAELDLKCVRLAWDSLKSEQAFRRAFALLRGAGIAKRRIRVYVLIGYKDDPESALYRLQSVRELGLWPFPMRYQPLDARERNEYVGPGWSEAELTRYVKYFSNLRVTGGIPFEEFRL